MAMMELGAILTEINMQHELIGMKKKIWKIRGFFSERNLLLEKKKLPEQKVFISFLKLL